VLAYFKGTEKKFKKYGISCHKDTKFLHTIAEGFLYLMLKKCKIYVYLEPDTTIGNYEAGNLKFVVTRRPLQFTHFAGIMFVVLPIKTNSNFYFQ
jgi:hypothetical protein